VHIPYYTGLIDAVPHVPDRCLKAGGWVPTRLPENMVLPIDRSTWSPDPDRVNLDTGKPYLLKAFRHHVTGEQLAVRMPIGDFELRTTEFRDASRPDVRIFAGYFFIANGRVTPTPEGVRSLAFDLTSKSAYYAKVQFTMQATGDMTQEIFAEKVAEFAGELLPELMLCLPEWSEIEAETVAPAS
jgi:hypothetical protein